MVAPGCLVRDAVDVDEFRHVVRPLSYRYILLPLDGSAFALAAVATARALAERFDAELVTISVSADEREAESLRRHVFESLRAIDENAATKASHVEVASDPAERISARAAELGSCLVCMSTRGRGRIAGAMIGSVARAVLQSSRAPVVVVGPHADRPSALAGRPRRRPPNWPKPLSVGGVVACVDGSPQSEAVLPVAAQWAVALAVRLSILTVAEDAASALGSDRPNRFGPTDPRRYVDTLADRWQQAAPGAVGEVVFDPIGVASGVRAPLAAKPAGLVAVTTSARSGLDRVLLGATAADIVRTSSAPALVVAQLDL